MDPITTSTARIMTGLLREAHQVTSLPLNNPDVCTAAAQDCRVAHLHAKLDQPSHTEETIRFVTVGIKELSASTDPQAKRFATSFNTELNDISPKATQLRETQNELMKRYQQLANDTQKSIDALLNNAIQKKGAPDVGLEKIKQEVKALTSAQTSWRKSEDEVQAQLDKLHFNIYHAMPTTSRQNMVPPRKMQI